MSSGGGRHGVNVHSESIRRMNLNLARQFGERRRAGARPEPVPAPAADPRRRHLVLAVVFLAAAAVVLALLLR